MFIRLLGPVLAGNDEDQARPVGGQIPSALLAHLTLARGRVLPLEALIDFVWDAPTDTARNAVHVAVSGLRKKLGPELLQGGRTGYRLLTDMLRVDAEEAESFLQEGERAFAAGNLAASLTASEEVLARFVGEPLAALKSSRSQIERDRALSLRRSAVVMRAEALIELHRAAQAIEFLRMEVAKPSLDEQLYELLMRSFVQCDRLPEALDVYDRLRKLLAAELGTDPRASIKELFTRILAGDARPEPALQPSFGPLSLSLPSPATPILGRDRDAREVVEQVGRGNRLVTVVGPGGMGKTRLAVEVGRVASKEEQRPVAFVDLVSARDQSDVWAIAANVLVTEPDAIGAALEGRRMLVILDNAEHVLDAVVELTKRLLAVSGTNVLITSRSPLRLVGEVIFDLDGLSVDAATQLLVDRAGYRKSEALASQSDLRNLAVRAECVPLTLELLAPSLQWEQPAEVTGRLEELLLSTVDESLDRTARHSSILAVVEWSALQASEAARRALGALCIIQGSFSESAARTIITAAGKNASARIVLTELVNLSLIKRVQEPGVLKFKILEPVRLYARNSPDIPPPGAAVESAHASHYLLALDDVYQLFGSQSDEFDTMVRDEDANFRQAVRWALAHDTDLAFTHGRNVLWGWYGLARHHEVQTICSDLLEGGGGTPDQKAYIAVCYLASIGDSAKSTASMKPLALDLAEQQADFLDDDWHRRWIGAVFQIARQEGDLEYALELMTRMRMTNPTSRHYAISGRVTALSSLGRTAEAAEEAERGVAETRSEGDRTSRVYALSNLGYNRIAMGQYELAERALSEALQLTEGIGRAVEQECVELNCGWLELERGHPQAALEWVARTLKGQRWAADWGGCIECLAISCQSLIQVGDRDAALQVGQDLIIRLKTGSAELLDPYAVRHIDQISSLLNLDDNLNDNSDQHHPMDDSELLGLIQPWCDKEQK